MALIEGNDSTIESELMGFDGVALVGFRMEGYPGNAETLALLQQTAGKYSNIKVIDVDVARCPMTAQMMQVRQVPFFAIASQGRLLEQAAGMLDAAAIDKLLAPHLPAQSAQLETKELFALLQQQRVVPVDIRDASSFERYHIPGAIHVPALDLKTRSAELSSADGLMRVLYGRSDEAKAEAEKLDELGIPVGFLAGGFLHWEADGFPVEEGE